MRIGWALLLALAGNAALRAADGRSAGVEVRIAVVIPTGAEGGARFHLRLGAELEAQLRERGAAGSRVTARWVDTAQAAALLQARRCDAVVVLGGERPGALRRVAERTFAGSLGREFGFRPAYLLLGTGDAVTAEGLVAAFPLALRVLSRGD